MSLINLSVPPLFPSVSPAIPAKPPLELWVELAASMSRRRLWSLPAAAGILVPAILGGWTLTAVFAADPSPVASAGAKATVPGGDATKGQDVYNQNCTSCHGPTLGGGIGPKLNPIQKLGNTGNPADPDYLVETIGSGLQGVAGFSTAMPAFAKSKGGQLSDQDIKNVAAFILASQGKATTLDPTELARSNVFWVSAVVGALLLLTYLLASYNMRWIDRRAVARRERERLS